MTDGERFEWAIKIALDYLDEADKNLRRLMVLEYIAGTLGIEDTDAAIQKVMAIPEVAERIEIAMKDQCVARDQLRQNLRSQSRTPLIRSPERAN